MSTVPLRADHGMHEPQKLSFWQKPFVQDVVPFLMSLTFHLSIVAIGLLAVKTVHHIINAAVEPPPPPFLPDVAPIEMPSSPSAFSLGLPDGKDDRTMAIHKFELPPDGVGATPTKIVNLISGRQGEMGGGGDGTDTASIAVGPGSGPFGGGLGNGGTGDGKGTGDGTGDGAFWGLAPKGDRNSIARATQFANVPGKASKVVFLCDSSGSMLHKFDALRTEIRKAVGMLSPVQSFGVVFFAKDTYKTLDTTLVSAVPDAKRRASEFLDTIAPEGSSDPLPGLRAAFAMQPQLIYLLTDGDFPNNDQVMAEIRRLNASKRVTISTIALMDRGEAYERLLSAIAKENQGTFKFVSESDLQP